MKIFHLCNVADQEIVNSFFLHINPLINKHKIELRSEIDTSLIEKGDILIVFCSKEFFKEDYILNEQFLFSIRKKAIEIITIFANSCTLLSKHRFFVKKTHRGQFSLIRSNEMNYQLIYSEIEKIIEGKGNSQFGNSYEIGEIPIGYNYIVDIKSEFEEIKKYNHDTSSSSTDFTLSYLLNQFGYFNSQLIDKKIIGTHIVIENVLEQENIFFVDYSIENLQDLELNIISWCEKLEHSSYKCCFLFDDKTSWQQKNFNEYIKSCKKSKEIYNELKIDMVQYLRTGTIMFSPLLFINNCAIEEYSF